VLFATLAAIALAEAQRAEQLRTGKLATVASQLAESGERPGAPAR
jgi:hypothetical protein